MERAEGGRYSRRLAVLAALLLVVASLSTFRGALNGAFLPWDDDVNITSNPHLGPPNADNLAWMFTDYRYMRRYVPLGWLGFSGLFTVDGFSPVVFHLATIGVHTANGVLVFGLLLILLRRWNPSCRPRWRVACALAGAALWLLHPFRVETVGWISGLLYDQAGFLALVSLFCYLRAGDAGPGSVRRTWLLAALAAYAGSLLTYPMALGWFAVFFLIDIAERRPEARAGARWILALPAAGVLAITVFARFQASAFWRSPPNLAEFPLTARVVQVLYVFFYYIRRSFVPARLTPAPTQLFQFDPGATPFVASAVAVAVITIALAAKKSWRRGPLLLWIAYLAVLAPMAGFTENPHYPSDRYSYLPSTLFSAGLALWMSTLRGRPQRLTALAAAALAAIACVPASRAQVAVWWTWDSLAQRLVDGTNNDEVRRQTLVNWARRDALEGRVAQAKAILARARRDYPAGTGGDFAEASLAPFLPAPPAGPDEPPMPLYAGAQLSMAVDDARAARSEEAAAHFRRSLELAPESRIAEYDYAAFEAAEGRPEYALHLYLLATRPGAVREEDREKLLLSIARSYRNAGRPELAALAEARARGQILPALRDSTIR